MVPVGTIHGRFQPFHLGHLDYALKALGRCRHLIVGITNPDPSHIVEVEEDPLRHLAESNPFTYFERYAMVRGALEEQGVPGERFSIVPFPIHHPERWASYFPPGAVVFIRLFSDWGAKKVERFERAGYPVEILDPGARKQVSGLDVRGGMLSGGDWEALLPQAVTRLLREIGAPERLAKLATREEDQRGRGQGLGEAPGKS